MTSAGVCPGVESAAMPAGTSKVAEHTAVEQHELDAQTFLDRHAEDAAFNQYWYSRHTIAVLVQELQAVASKIAFLSTPSLFFSLPQGCPQRKASYLFDLDAQWASQPNTVLYDFAKPEAIPAGLHHSFDCVVIDPPFISPEAWHKYAATTKLLLQPGGKIIATTIQENAGLLSHQLGLQPQRFLPSIPNLVYQYSLFTNYFSDLLSQPNQNIPDDT